MIGTLKICTLPLHIIAIAFLGAIISNQHTKFYNKVTLGISSFSLFMNVIGLLLNSRINYALIITVTVASFGLCLGQAITTLPSQMDLNWLTWTVVPACALFLIASLLNIAVYFKLVKYRLDIVNPKVVTKLCVTTLPLSIVAIPVLIIYVLSKQYQDYQGIGIAETIIVSCSMILNTLGIKFQQKTFHVFVLFTSFAAFALSTTLTILTFVSFYPDRVNWLCWILIPINSILLLAMLLDMCVIERLPCVYKYNISLDYSADDGSIEKNRLNRLRTMTRIISF